MTDWTEAESADGPKLAAWLRQADRLPSTGGCEGEIGSLFNAVSRWERGERASLCSVDHWLTMLGLHISQVPDEVWSLETVRSANSPHPRRAEGLEMLEEELSVREISRRLDVAPATVRSWRRLLRPERVAA